MNSIAEDLTKTARAKPWLAALLAIGLIDAVYGQELAESDQGADAHDHASEAAPDAALEGHVDHDDDQAHSDEASAQADHDHAEEEAHGETHAAHQPHDDHRHGAADGELGGEAAAEAEHADHASHGDPASEDAHEEHDGQDDHGGHDEHGDGDEHAEGVVTVTPEVMREFDIALAEAGPGILQEEVVLPGEIQFNREQLAYATPRYAGTVTSIKARLADRVRAGQVLATLESTETLRPFEVKAPFDGTIVAYEVTPGETVEAGKPLFTVADLSSVWADLQIYQRDLNKIRHGLPVTIINGHGGPSFSGTITYIAPTIDEHTRTGLARVIADNARGEWRPGQFIKGVVTTEEHQVDIAIPRSAVLTDVGQTVVFVQTEEGFEPRPVVLGHSDHALLEVKEGLVPGETYVARNAISLKAELGKGAFGGHVH
ncbi:MAG: efflux RND transporter periplasmic adaptor subunit [Chromatiaceae bacterium]|jgi:cobalt-zinc-cadmium efflux system membrane fusion protein|nr:efflux RND transporter periplasmic adaptor subunit [Chromatiaceae bacterium]